jgi:hypothetical protein
MKQIVGLILFLGIPMLAIVLLYPPPKCEDCKESWECPVGFKVYISYRNWENEELRHITFNIRPGIETYYTSAELGIHSLEIVPDIEVAKRFLFDEYPSPVRRTGPDIDMLTGKEIE